jgi:hypothetical protein
MIQEEAFAQAEKVELRSEPKLLVEEVEFRGKMAGKYDAGYRHY